MDVVVRMLPEHVRAALDLFSELLFIATMAAVVYFVAPVIRDLAAFDQRSQAADFPLVIPQALVPIGFSIMGLLVAVRLLIGARQASAENRH
jgi:TRAP-type C4-dicarboxylate transport system permease small subunit